MIFQVSLLFQGFIDIIFGLFYEIIILLIRSRCQSQTDRPYSLTFRPFFAEAVSSQEKQCNFYAFAFYYNTLNRYENDQVIIIFTFMLTLRVYLSKKINQKAEKGRKVLLENSNYSAILYKYNPNCFNFCLFIGVLMEIIIIKMSQSKAKFIDRFRTQIIKPITSPGQKSQRQIQASLSSQLRSFNAQQQTIQQEKIQSNIIDRLQKHIEFIEKKLKDTQKQMQNLSNTLEQCLRRLAQKDVELENTMQQMEAQKKKIISLQDTNQFLKNEYQTFILRTKMEKLSVQVTNRKEFIEKLEQKHNQKKKGRFSSAFLPASFNGQSKYTSRKAEHFQAIIQQYQVKNIQQTAFININNLTQSLTIQYKKLQQDFQKSQQQLNNKIATINQLNERIHNLQRDNGKNSKKQAETINNEKCEQQTQSENIKIQVQQVQNASSSLKIELALSKQQNKRLLEKIKQSEERMVEISDAIRETTDLELNNMFTASISEIDIPQIKNSDRFNISNSVVNLKISVCEKIEKQAQTNIISEFQQKEILLEDKPFPSVQLENSPISDASVSNSKNSSKEQAQMFERLQDEIERYFIRRQSQHIKKDIPIEGKETNGDCQQPIILGTPAKQTDTQQEG